MKTERKTVISTQKKVLHQIWDAPAQAVVSHMRKEAMLARVDNSQYPDMKDVAYVSTELASILADAHVFDLGHLLDENHPDFLTQQTCQDLYEEAKTDLANGELHLPFGNLLLILRAVDEKKGDGYIEVINCGQDENGHVFAGVWVLTVLGFWSLAYVFVIDEERVHGPYPKRLKPEIAVEGRMQNAAMLLASIALLNRQGEAVVLTDCPKPQIIRPRTFELPNPTVRVLTVDRPRLRYPRTYSPASTGRQQGPHDRRAHWCVSKKGTRFWRGGEGIRVNGGAIDNLPTVIKTRSHHDSQISAGNGSHRDLPQPADQRAVARDQPAHQEQPTPRTNGTGLSGRAAGADRSRAIRPPPVPPPAQVTRPAWF